MVTAAFKCNQDAPIGIRRSVLHIVVVTPLVSLITCSRSPDDAIVAAVLTAVRALRLPDGWRMEHLLVDNASTPSLAERDSVARHLAACPAARLLRDETDGLATVRARAIRATAGELLITVDDDNVLDAGYLEAVIAAAAALPDIGIFGAGHIAVSLPERAPSWAADPWVRRLFQERHLTTPMHGCSRAWQDYYSPGTGMVVRRQIAEAFADGVERGELRNASRRRGHLSGGEDAQLVWLCVRSGLAVGAVPAMRVTHVIPSRRLTAGYVCRLVFGIHESAAPARFEVLRDEPPPPCRPGRAWLRAVRAVPMAGPFVVWRARVAAAAGDAAALCLVHERPEPWWLRALIALLGGRRGA